MSYMSGLMLGTAIVRGLGSLLSSGPAAGMGFMDMGAGSGMGRGAMGRSSGVGGLFGMMPTGRQRAQGRGAGHGRLCCFICADAAGLRAEERRAWPQTLLCLGPAGQ